MGYYINPKDMSKEQYLEKHGVLLNSFSTWPLEDNTKTYICLVDNGIFTAAAICYSQNEFLAFKDTLDVRRKWWYSIPKQILINDGFIKKEKFEI